jgi:hypothetical protein
MTIIFLKAVLRYAFESGEMLKQVLEGCVNSALSGIFLGVTLHKFGL